MIKIDLKDIPQAYTYRDVDCYAQVRCRGFYELKMMIMLLYRWMLEEGEVRLRLYCTPDDEWCTSKMEMAEKRSTRRYRCCLE